MNFSGEFETHITFALTEERQWDALTAWCQARSLKCVQIELDRGLYPSQPMVTLFGVGTLESELLKAEEVQRECEMAGFQVSRLKLEVAPWNEDVPATQQEVEPAMQRYFEHHIKLLLPSNSNLDELKERVVLHGAHLSRNARRVREDGLQERFVTQRCYRVGREEARQSFEELLGFLEPLGFPVLETEEEYVVFDSNIVLDAGWLDENNAGLEAMKL